MGLKILSLSRGALSGIDVREGALPIMRDLMEKTNLSCHLAILDGPEAVYIEKVEPQGFIRMRCVGAFGVQRNGWNRSQHRDQRHDSPGERAN